MSASGEVDERGPAAERSTVPGPATVLHFSEDPGIETFVPHVAATASMGQAYVWAVDADQAPSYWFPRQCPRAMAWSGPGSTAADRRTLLGPGAARVHLVEYGWLTRIQSVQLYAYRFDAAAFSRYGDPGYAYVATETVRPLGPPERVGDLLARHVEAGIELRLTSSLWPWWRAVVASSLEFSGIRLRHARPEGTVANVGSR